MSCRRDRTRLVSDATHEEEAYNYEEEQNLEIRVKDCKAMTRYDEGLR